MKREQLTSLSLEELKQKEKSTKTFIGIFVGLIIVMLFAQIFRYFKDGTFEVAVFGITICTIGGMVSLFPNLKMIREEIQLRQA